MTKSELAAKLYSRCVEQMHAATEDDPEGYSKVAIYCLVQGVLMAATELGVESHLTALLEKDPDFVALEAHVVSALKELQKPGGIPHAR